MTAQLIPTSSEAEWLEARRQGITASEIAVVMGLSPYSSPYALYHGKLGNLPDAEQTEDMALGQYMEDYVAGRFAGQHPEFTVTGDGRALYAHPGRPWQMATPDRLVYESPEDAYQYPGVPLVEPLAVLECKIDGGSDEWGEEGSDEIPVHYRCQGLWQMDVMDVANCDVACLDWQRRKVRFYQLTMDDAARADLKLMREEARCFLDRIDLQDPPDVDWRPATAAALKHLHPSIEDRDAHIGRQLEISYRAAVRRYKEAERRKDEMTNRLREVMGNGRRAVAARTWGSDGDRIVIATRQVYDVKESVRKAYTVNKLVPARAPKET
jgi:putative phage-type endonuclease